jgi:DNA modification methylase
MKEKEKRMMDGGEFYNGGFTKSEKVTNNHPTLKPIALTEKILKLFKTPNKQRILIPFAGSGSEIIGAIKVGFEDIEGCEINEEYCQIAEARIKYWKKEKESKLL